MKPFWVHDCKIVAYEYFYYKRSMVNFVVINTSNWSTKTIEVPLNRPLGFFTTQSDVIMRLYSYEQGGFPPSRKIVVERIAHMQ